MLTRVVGNHVLKFGGEYRIDMNSNGEIGGARPLYTFLQQWNFANGTPIFDEIAADLNGKPASEQCKVHDQRAGIFHSGRLEIPSEPYGQSRTSLVVLFADHSDGRRHRQPFAGR